MRAISTLLVTGLILAATSARLAAEDRIDPAALSLAKSFARICILAIPDFNNVILTARIEGWPQVEGPPRDKLAEWRGPSMRSAWLTKGVDGLPVGVVIVRKPDPKVRAMTATCAVQNPGVTAASMGDALAAVLPVPEPEKSIDTSEQKTTVWTLQWGNRTVGIGMVAERSKPGVILNAVIQQNVR